MVAVQDVVELLMRLAQQREAVGEAFFCAAPRPTTLDELQGWVAEELGVKARAWPLHPAVLRVLAAGADVVTQVSGKKLPLNRKLARQLLAPAWTCSTEKAERRLGFVAQRSLRDSVAESTRWYLEHGWL
jgi:nucleoside-diphosphate-sugar epimerase